MSSPKPTPMPVYASTAYPPPTSPASSASPSTPPGSIYANIRLASHSTHGTPHAIAFFVVEARSVEIALDIEGKPFTGNESNVFDLDSDWPACFCIGGGTTAATDSCSKGQDWRPSFLPLRASYVHDSRAVYYCTRHSSFPNFPAPRSVTIRPAFAAPSHSVLLEAEPRPFLPPPHGCLGVHMTSRAAARRPSLAGTRYVPSLATPACDLQSRPFHPGRSGSLDVHGNCRIGAINSENGGANQAKNRITGEYGVVPQRLGSPREHAAFEPCLLGGIAAIARSFARIHETSPGKQGILAVAFADYEGYEKVRPHDRVDTVGLE
ncbi:uncharacterized protein B0H18DRAFT_1120604 [Fomitopsis serialis]|uniref:uncharacterized protein n=1 Tax=Fomitopsis serialis TaxID=139415 RepID=UPI0020089974|nr:uncharacterized protein B0H18DRAFT_1120604 [Neoantrodia serialis]KAH9923081.1 hypothetical protein B0H18DRAFT_1120604 [Neoantrodia serialis]